MSMNASINYNGGGNIIKDSLKHFDVLNREKPLTKTHNRVEGRKNEEFEPTVCG